MEFPTDSFSLIIRVLKEKVCPIHVADSVPLAEIP